MLQNGLLSCFGSIPQAKTREEDITILHVPVIMIVLCTSSLPLCICLYLNLCRNENLVQP